MSNAAKLEWAPFKVRYETLLAEDLTPERVPTWLQSWSDLEKEVGEVAATLYRAKDEDTRDEAAEKAYLYFVQEISPKARELEQALKTKLLEVEGYEPPRDLDLVFYRFRNEQSLFRQENVALYSEIQTLENDYGKLVGAITLDWEGREATIPEVQRMLLEPNRNVRERAWHTVSSALNKVVPELDEVFLGLFSLRRDLARNAGFEDYRAFRWRELGRFDYTPKDSLTLIDAIEFEVVPVLSEVWEQRRKQLGVERLRPWDVQVDPASRPPLKPFTEVSELEDGLERIFTRLEPELAQDFAALRDGWLDLASRPGKVPNIGYMSYFPQSNSAYIYYNAVGTHTDVWVLLHELGHAFHAQASGRAQPLVWQGAFEGGPEFGEVPSQAMELLALPYLLAEEGGFYTAEEAGRAEQEQLLRVLRLFVSVARWEAFDHWLYSEAPADLEIAQVDAKWLALQERFFPWEDWTGLEARRAKTWQDFNSFGDTFYSLHYAMAFLGAIQIWRGSLRDRKTALRRYRYALTLGATRSTAELFKAAGAKFVFDRETVREEVGFVAGRRRNLGT